MTLEVAWEWAYQVGDSPLRTPVEAAAPADGYRDAERRERAAGQLDLPLDRFGLRHGAVARRAAGCRAPGCAARRLAGIDTMRFTTELLPLLTGQPGRHRRGQRRARRLPGGQRLAADRAVHR